MAVQHGTVSYDADGYLLGEICSSHGQMRDAGGWGRGLSQSDFDNVKAVCLAAFDDLSRRGCPTCMSWDQFSQASGRGDRLGYNGNRWAECSKDELCEHAFDNKALSREISQGRRDFTDDELSQMQVAGVTVDSRIRAGRCWYRPVTTAIVIRADGTILVAIEGAVTVTLDAAGQRQYSMLSFFQQQKKDGSDQSHGAASAATKGQKRKTKKRKTGRDAERERTPGPSENSPPQERGVQPSEDDDSGDVRRSRVRRAPSGR